MIKNRIKKTFAVVAFFAFALSCVACGNKSTPAPTPSAAPAQPAPEPAAVEAAAPAEAKPASGLDGSWEGSSGEDMPVTFSVAGNVVSGVYVKLKAKKGGCSVFSSMGAKEDATLNGKSFTAKGKHEEFEFTLNGTFTSDTEASGTIDWKTNTNICGQYDTQLKWTAKKGAPSAEDEED